MVFAHVKAQSRNPACILYADAALRCLLLFFAAAQPVPQHNYTA